MSRKTFPKIKMAFVGSSFSIWREISSQADDSGRWDETVGKNLEEIDGTYLRK